MQIVLYILHHSTQIWIYECYLRLKKKCSTNALAQKRSWMEHKGYRIKNQEQNFINIGTAIIRRPYYSRTLTFPKKFVLFDSMIALQK